MLLFLRQQAPIRPLDPAMQAAAALQAPAAAAPAAAAPAVLPPVSVVSPNQKEIRVIFEEN